MVRLKGALLAITMTLVMSNFSFSQSSVEHMDELSTAFAELKDDTWKYLRTITKGRTRTIIKNNNKSSNNKNN